MRTSPAGISLIKRHEDEAGFLRGRCTRLEAYLCPSGVPTIGWGHTHGVTLGMTITWQEANALLMEDILRVEQEFGPLVGSTPVTEGQWDALVSLGFNLRGGPRAIPVKAPKLWAAFKRGDREAAAKEFLDINHGDGGVELGGLTTRRKEESELFLS